MENKPPHPSSEIDPLFAAYKLMEGGIIEWGQLFFPIHFGKKSPPFHRELITAAVKYQYLAIAAPRKSAKSTYLSFLYPFHRIVFKKEPFIVLISNTFKKAAMYLDTIKSEIITNVDFKETFPPIVFERDAEGDTIFKHPDGYRTMFLCKGVDQIGGLRGVKFGPHRPGLILIDDMEDDTLVRNQELRLKLKNEFDEVLGRLGHDKTKVIVVGTILHDDSQLSRLVNPDQYAKFHKIIYRAHINADTPNEKSLWPEEWSLDYLHQLRKDEPNVYAKEMQNDPVAGSNTRFKKEDFRQWKYDGTSVWLMNEIGEPFQKYDVKDCKAAIACDLAWLEKREADFSVLMPGLITPNSEILVDTYICKKGMRPDEAAEQLFIMVERLEKLTGSNVPIGFEKSMLEKVTQWLLKREMKSRGKFLMTKELQWDTDKQARIELRLQPRYAQHVIFHKQGMGDLEHQLERFPYGTNDDLCFASGTKIATEFGDKNIEDINIGDKVITPFGLREILSCGFTGFSNIIDRFGLKCTPKHKIFNWDSCFVSIDTLQYNASLSRLNLKEIILWRFQKLLNLMEKNIEEWEGKESIIFLNQNKNLEEKTLKDFMLRFGKNIGKLKFQKIFMFTMLMVIHLIMTLKILCVYRLWNIISFLKILIGKKWLSILKELGQKLQNGIDQNWEENGIENMQKKCGSIQEKSDLNVEFAGNHFNHLKVIHMPVLNPVEIEKNISLKMVFNLKVKEDGIFYANGVLVSNCDSLQGLIQLLQIPKEAKHSKPKESEFDWWRQQSINARKVVSQYHPKTGEKARNRWINIPARIGWK